MAPKKRPRTVLDRVSMQSAGGHHESVDAVKRADVVAAVISGRMHMYEAAKAFGVSYSSVLRWVREDHYLEIAKRYQERLQALQEGILLSVEGSLKSMHQILEYADDSEWLMQTDPERISAMADLYKAQSDTFIRFMESLQRATARTNFGLD